MKNRVLKVQKSRLQDQGNDDDLRETTPAERLAMLWPMTLTHGASEGIFVLNPDYRDILSIFNEEKVECIVFGAGRPAPGSRRHRPSRERGCEGVKLLHS